MKFIIKLVCSSLLLSCNSDYHFVHTSKSPYEISDTFIRVIPKQKNGSYFPYYKHKPDVENKMRLISLENGFDSLQVRIWLSFDRIDSSQLLLIKRSEGKWIGNLYSFTYITDERNRILSIPFKKFITEPKSGWATVMKKLTELQIFTLPDSGSIQNYPDWVDAGAIIIEIATTKSYKIYMYVDPLASETKIWQAKKMEQIIHYLQSEFNFKLLRHL